MHAPNSCVASAPARPAVRKQEEAMSAQPQGDLSTGWTLGWLEPPPSCFQPFDLRPWCLAAGTHTCSGPCSWGFLPSPCLYISGFSFGFVLSFVQSSGLDVLRSLVRYSILPLHSPQGKNYPEPLSLSVALLGHWSGRKSTDLGVE